MMKYKIGDKVCVRKDLKVGDVYGSCIFTRDMKDFCGKIVRITEVNRRGLCIASCDCYWTEEMFEDDVDMEVQGMNKRVIIDVYGNKVVARCGDKEGVARCHPDDDFDFYIGAKLSLKRLEEIDKPYGWLKVEDMYYVPYINTISNEYLYKVHKYYGSSMDKAYMERGIVFQTKEEAIACAKKMLAAVKQEG